MILRENRDAKLVSYHFDSLHEMAKYIEDTPKTWRGNESTGCRASPTWDLDIGYTKAVETAKYGWIEGAQKSQATLKRLRATTPQPIKTLKPYGHKVNLSRYLGGNPRCFQNKKTIEGQSPVLTLIVPVNATARVSAESMSNFGLGIAHYISQLQSNGTRVEVIGAMHSDVEGWKLTHTWTIKRANQPLDLAVLSFAVGHPAMFRRLGFAVRERSCVPEVSHYGYSAALALDYVIQPPRGAIILNGMKDADRVASTPEKACAYIATAIEKALHPTP